MEPAWKVTWKHLLKLKTLLLLNWTITLLGIYPMEIKPSVHRNKYTRILCVVLVICKDTGNSECPKVSKWWHSHTIEYYESCINGLGRIFMKYCRVRIARCRKEWIIWSCFCKTNNKIFFCVCMYTIAGVLKQKGWMQIGLEMWVTWLGRGEGKPS